MLLLKDSLIKKKSFEREKKNLLIYAHYYYPDVASTGQILTELAEGLKDAFRITVICTVPSYTGKISQYYKKHKYYYENINGINVLRIRVPEFRKSFAPSRIYNIASYFLSAIAATFRIEEQDYIFTISQPPILGGLLGVIGKKIKHARFIYNIQDFNPEQIMAVSYAKNKFVLNAMMALDKYSCRQADKVIVVGRDMIDTLKRRFPENGKKQLPIYSYINNWIDEKSIVPLSKEQKEVTDFKKKYGIEDKYVIMYSGNIGLYYDLLNLIKVIGKFKDCNEVAFLFVGEGSVLEQLKDYVKKQNLSNVYFAPYQDKDKLVYSLNVGDVHFVVNAKGIKGVSVPSKLYGVMAAGKPVLGILEKGSEARLIIEESNCGISVSPGDYEAIEKLIEYFIRTRESREQKNMGMAGREYLTKYLTKEVSIEKYRQEISERD
ncbi:MAG: glycosyltransferase family 4 protein [Lachnospiraceae bacterium]|nr:glycosyltransferase family 4 protein [Lachnospiraceae bacterium]